MKLAKRLTLALVLCLFATPALARDHVTIAGSSTVLPYASIVAEQFGRSFREFKTPIVESGGSSAGLKQFCQGTDINTIDIANSSRKIKQSELEACAAAGVKNPIEVKFGYDGIVFATSSNGPPWKLTPKDIYLALSKDSKHTHWNQVNPSLPNWPIVVYIPGEKHGTREVFEEKVLVEGCKAAGKYTKETKKLCMQVRKDGAAVDIDGDYTETLARLKSNKRAMGVFGLSFYENNTDLIRVATINGVTPSVETVASGQYPVSRPLFFYVKREHLSIPGLKQYVKFFTSKIMLSKTGPLADYGLVPLPAKEFEQLNNMINQQLN